MLSFCSDLDRQEDSLALMVRKLTVLKKGLMTERTLRREAEEREKSLQSQLHEAQRRAKEKEQMASQLAQKNKELMLRIAEADYHCEVPSQQDKDIDDATRKKSKKEVETENKQLVAETKRLSDLLKAVHTGEHEYSTQQLMQARAERDQLERRVQQITDEAQRREEKAQLETKTVMDMNYALLAEQKSLEEKLASVSAKLRVSERSLSDKEATGLTQAAELEVVRKNFEEQKMVMKQLAKKMVLLKTKVQALELPLKHYHVTIPSRLTGHRPAEIKISKNPTTHELMLCVTSNNIFDVYNMDDIASVSVGSDASQAVRFWVQVEGRPNDPLVFESPAASCIAADINQYMGVACHNRQDHHDASHPTAKGFKKNLA